MSLFSTPVLLNCFPHKIVLAPRLSVLSIPWVYFADSVPGMELGERLLAIYACIFLLEMKPSLKLQKQEAIWPERIGYRPKILNGHSKTGWSPFGDVITCQFLSFDDTRSSLPDAQCRFKRLKYTFRLANQSELFLTAGQNNRETEV